MWTFGTLQNSTIFGAIIGAILGAYFGAVFDAIFWRIFWMIFYSIFFAIFGSIIGKLLRQQLGMNQTKEQKRIILRLIKEFFMLQRSIFQTFWRPNSCTNFLFLKLTLVFLLISNLTNRLRLHQYKIKKHLLMNFVCFYFNVIKIITRIMIQVMVGNVISSSYFQAKEI